MIDPRNILKSDDNHGISLPDLEGLQNARILGFTQSNKGEPMSKDYGKVIFVDQQYRDIVRVGETWICRIKHTNRDYDFAIPVQRIDGEFILDMKEEHKEELAKILITDHRDIVQELVIPIIRPQLENQIVKSENRPNKDTDEEKNMDREKPIRDDDVFTINPEPSWNNFEPVIGNRVPRTNDRMFGDLSFYEARMISPNILTSPMFKSSRYSVRVSLDGKKITIESDPEGCVSCTDYKMTIWGLESIVDFREDMIMKLIPSKIDGSMLIKLP